MKAGFSAPLFASAFVLVGCAQLVGLDQFTDGPNGGAGASQNGGGGAGAGPTGGGGTGAGPTGGGGAGAAGPCEVGASCYEGPAGTLGVGTCTAGQQVCDAEGQLASCDGQVLPAPLSAALCASPQDLDCNGVACGEPLWARFVQEPSGAATFTQQAVEGAVVAPDGSIFVTGWFEGTIAAPDGSSVSSAARDGFVHKYSPDGTPLAGFHTTSTGGSVNLLRLALRPDGGVVAVGTYTTGVTVAGTALPPAQGVTAPIDGLVLSLGPDLTFDWVTPLPGTGTDQLKRVATDENGEIYVGGTTTSTNIAGFSVEDSNMLAHLSPAGVIELVAGIDLTGGEVEELAATSSPSAVYVAAAGLRRLGASLDVPTWVLDVPGLEALSVEPTSGGVRVTGACTGCTLPLGASSVDGLAGWSVSAAGVTQTESIVPISGTASFQTRWGAMLADGSTFFGGTCAAGTSTLGGLPITCGPDGTPWVLRAEPSGAGVWALKLTSASNAYGSVRGGALYMGGPLVVGEGDGVFDFFTGGPTLQGDGLVALLAP